MIVPDGHPPVDRYARRLGSLRVSVTDRCNLRCSYCMPEAEYAWLPRQDILTFEEIVRVADVFLGMGVDRIRITGGEPLLRRDLNDLVRLLAGRPGLRDLALTTNGLLLAEQARPLHQAGLGRLTVSLDTLRPDRFRTLTRQDRHADVLAGLEAAVRAGFQGIKLDTVVIRGTNDDEIVELLEYARSVPAEIRFIEYMDVGGATRWTREQVVPRAEMLARLEERYGPPTPLPELTSAPAARYRLPDGLVFGIISSTTQPFCARCDRARLTADGLWLLCLYAVQGLDLRTPLRQGASDEELRKLIVGRWTERTDRGAEERLALAERTPLAGDPHFEMHTRGG